MQSDFLFESVEGNVEWFSDDPTQESVQYFTKLTETALQGFASEEDVMPSDYITLADYIEAAVDEGDSSGATFFIIANPDEGAADRFLRAADAEEAAYWVHAINAILLNTVPPADDADLAEEAEHDGEREGEEKAAFTTTATTAATAPEEPRTAAAANGQGKTNTYVIQPSRQPAQVTDSAPPPAARLNEYRVGGNGGVSRFENKTDNNNANNNNANNNNENNNNNSNSYYRSASAASGNGALPIVADPAGARRPSPSSASAAVSLAAAADEYSNGLARTPRPGGSSPPRVHVVGGGGGVGVGVRTTTVTTHDEYREGGGVVPASRYEETDAWVRGDAGRAVAAAAEEAATQKTNSNGSKYNNNNNAGRGRRGYDDEGDERDTNENNKYREENNKYNLNDNSAYGGGGNYNNNNNNYDGASPAALPAGGRGARFGSDGNGYRRNPSTSSAGAGGGGGGGGGGWGGRASEGSFANNNNNNNTDDCDDNSFEPPYYDSRRRGGGMPQPQSHQQHQQQQQQQPTMATMRGGGGGAATRGASDGDNGGGNNKYYSNNANTNGAPTARMPLRDQDPNNTHSTIGQFQSHSPIRAASKATQGNGGNSSYIVGGEANSAAEPPSASYPPSSDGRRRGGGGSSDTGGGGGGYDDPMAMMMNGGGRRVGGSSAGPSPAPSHLGAAGRRGGEGRGREDADGYGFGPANGSNADYDDDNNSASNIINFNNTNTNSVLGRKRSGMLVNVPANQQLNKNVAPNTSAMWKQWTDETSGDVYVFHEPTGTLQVRRAGSDYFETFLQGSGDIPEADLASHPYPQPDDTICDVNGKIVRNVQNYGARRSGGGASVVVASPDLYREDAVVTPRGQYSPSRKSRIIPSQAPPPREPAIPYEGRRVHHLSISAGPGGAMEALIEHSVEQLDPRGLMWDPRTGQTIDVTARSGEDPRAVGQATLFKQWAHVRGLLTQGRYYKKHAVNKSTFSYRFAFLTGDNGYVVCVPTSEVMLNVHTSARTFNSVTETIQYYGRDAKAIALNNIDRVTLGTEEPSISRRRDLKPQNTFCIVTKTHAFILECETSKEARYFADAWNFFLTHSGPLNLQSMRTKAMRNPVTHGTRAGLAF